MRCFAFEEANLLLPAISHAAIFITTGSDTTMERHQNTYCLCSIYKVKKWVLQIQWWTLLKFNICRKKSHYFIVEPPNHLVITRCLWCEQCMSRRDWQYPSCLKLPAATAVIMDLHWGLHWGPWFPLCYSHQKSGLILPYPSPTYRKPLNWWMRTLWEMAGVVIPVIFLQMYLPLGWWSRGWTAT